MSLRFCTAALVLSALFFASPVTAFPLTVALAFFETRAVPSQVHTLPVPSTTLVLSTAAFPFLSTRAVPFHVYTFP